MAKQLSKEDLDQFRGQKAYLDQFDSFNNMIKNGWKFYLNSIKKKYGLKDEFDVKLEDGTIIEK